MSTRDNSVDPWADAPLSGRAAKKAAKQAKKAAKVARRAGKTRWHKQIAQVYKLVAKHQPLIWLWLSLIFVGIVGVGLLYGTFIWRNHTGYMAFLAAPAALLACTIFLGRRAETVAYGQIEDTPGAAASAIRTIRRGWTYSEEPTALDPRTMDMVFRLVGRPGVVLVGDGSTAKLKELLKKEHKRVARVAPGIPITELIVGKKEGQVPLRKLVKKLRRLKPALRKAALAEVNRRLQSLGGLKPPVPKGIDPFRARPDRRAMRGR